MPWIQPGRRVDVDGVVGEELGQVGPRALARLDARPEGDVAIDGGPDLGLRVRHQPVDPTGPHKICVR